MDFRTLRRARALGTAVGLSLLAPALAAQARDTTIRKPIELDSLVVIGKRPVPFGPLPGLLLDLRQIPSNVQTATGQELRAARVLSLTDFLNSQLQSVTVNDYSGNPLQADVQFRGFSASPQIGTPQGLSVFLDGVRVNEAFGDVVNWDLLPLNAVARMDVFPGSNPLFGLNTLGGALSLRTRNGFTDRGVEAQLSGGSWGRKQAQAAAGTSHGPVAAFAAVNWFDETGWRDHSPSAVQQGFLRLDYRGNRLGLSATGLLARNDLIGNGLIPLDMFRARSTNVFTSPDRTRNTLDQFQVSGSYDLTPTLNLTAQVYRRRSDRRATGGDMYEDFDEFDAQVDQQRGDWLPHALPYCQYVDENADGLPDSDPIIDPVTGDTLDTQVIILNGEPNQDCEDIKYTVQARNGRPGVVEGTPIGVLNKTRVGQLGHGAALQLNLNAERHRFMVGAGLDASDATYRMAQRLGLMTARREVYQDPAHIDPYYRAAQVDVEANNFDGFSRQWSLYASETWSPRANLHLNAGARYNNARVENRLNVRAFYNFGTALHNFTNRNIRRPRILCPTRDPASCPDSALAVYVLPDTISQVPTTEAHTYQSLNPSFGVTWAARPTLDLYANWSMGTRVPSTIELGCAFDATPVNVNEGIVDSLGNPVDPFLVPRSLLGPTCNLPTNLSGDPYLPQIRSRSGELGLRGTLGRHWSWNATAYRVDLDHDIQFTAVSSQRSYFQSIGRTRRQGIELGVAGQVGRASVRLNYAATDATYQSRFYMLSPHNSSALTDPILAADPDAAFAGGSISQGVAILETIRIDPGAHIPGVPIHNFNLGLDYRLARGWTVGAGVVAHSRSYLRGNENNRHQAGGNDSQVWYWIENADGSITRAQDTTRGRAFTLPGSVAGFAILNLRSTARLGHFTVALQVTNLFNRRYFTAGRLGINPFVSGTLGTNGPSGWNYNSREWQNTTFGGPAGPRQVTVGLSYALPGSEP
ncbi:MAG: TonB-dependent receptor [Gemmatimonadales bacterium]|nr:TonB-dependent receptor [Gemmatimonadales bacterium]